MTKKNFCLEICSFADQISIFFSNFVVAYFQCNFIAMLGECVVLDRSVDGSVGRALDF